MKISNSTSFTNESLRKILSACWQEFRKTETPRYKNLEVYVRWHNIRRRSPWVGGYAYYHRGLVVLKIPRTWSSGHPLEQSVADVFFHELGHTIGIRHCKGDAGERAWQDWIAKSITPEYALVVKAPKPKPDLKSLRYESAKRNLAKAVTRFRRAKTLLAKWTRKSKRYELSLAAANQKHEPS